jgi:hypothetical protein
LPYNASDFMLNSLPQGFLACVFVKPLDGKRMWFFSFTYGKKPHWLTFVDGKNHAKKHKGTAKPVCKKAFWCWRVGYYFTGAKEKDLFFYRFSFIVFYRYR